LNDEIKNHQNLDKGENKKKKKLKEEEPN